MDPVGIAGGELFPVFSIRDRSPGAIISSWNVLQVEARKMNISAN